MESQIRHSHPYFKQLIEELARTGSREKRIEVLNRARQSAHEEFPQQFAKLESLLLRYNPFVVLAMFAFYDLTYLPEVGKRMNHSDPVEQHHIEIIQAIILCHEEKEFAMASIDPVEFQEVCDLITYVAYLHSAKDFADHSVGLPDAEMSALQLRSMLRAHTKAVRGWGYEEQTLRVLKRLYGPLDDETEKELGVRISELIDATLGQIRSLEQRIQDHFTKLKSFMREKTVEGMVASYLKEFPDNDISTAAVNRLVTQEGWTFDNVRLMLMHRSNSFLLHVFVFEITEFTGGFSGTHANGVREVLSHWAVRLGELRDCKREHLFLCNPIWTRPIIRATDDVLFWPIVPLFHSFCFEMIDRIVSSRPHLKEKLSNRRADFLEEYTAELFRKKFPDANCFQGSRWRNADTNEEGENDLLMVFDSIALVVEEKSGAVNAGARRGGASIKQEIRQLITDAAEQAHAFAGYLQMHPTQHAFLGASGRVNHVDSSRLKQFFCINITLERFGPLATQMPKLQAAGLAKHDVIPTPTMSIADLEIALELLETPFELLHYLTRRTAFERNRVFVGDELDLLAFYVQTGFTLKAMPDPTRPLMINDLGRNLDPFLMARGNVHRFERPRRALSEWWRKLLAALEKRRVHGRYELGCILLDMPDDEQHAFEIQFRELCTKTKRNPQAVSGEVEAIWNPVKSEAANAVVVAAPVTTEIHSKRDFVIEGCADRAMTETGTDQALVILVDVELENWPYSGIYLITR